MGLDQRPRMVRQLHLTQFKYENDAKFNAGMAPLSDVKIHQLPAPEENQLGSIWFDLRPKHRSPHRHQQPWAESEINTFIPSVNSAS
jgi:hypothetical protein